MQTLPDHTTYSDTYADSYGTTVVDILAGDTLTVSAGLELYDADENFLLDISDDLAGGQVDRGNYRTIHGTCQLQISRELQWGSQRVKPYMVVSDGTSSIQVGLGVFVLSTPSRTAGETPATYDVDGYDKLEVLNHPHGTSYRAAAGDAYLTLVEALITGAGETKITLDQTSAATTLPTARVWPISEQTTTLNIVNDLLSAVGYRALWVDADGYYRSEPYTSPADRGAEWTYNAQSTDTTVGENRTAEADFFDAPNRWVFIRDDPAAAFPSDGDGIYTVVNQSDGATSIDSRGRTITRVVRLDAATQTSLVTQGDRLVERDKKLVKRLALSVSPNPLHLHFDVVEVVDSELSVSGRYLVTDWRLPLDGADMTLNLKAV